MTFLGFLLLVVNFLLFSYYDYDFTEGFVLSPWIWLVAAICQFSSHQLGIIKKINMKGVFFSRKILFLDGMDGKQARRTKTSSALGELFDHGVDSWASFLFPVCIFSLISKTDDGLSPIAMHLLLLSIYITFIDTHWEKYNTKVLFLPWSYDISMLVRLIIIEKHQFKRIFLCIYLVTNFSISISIFLYTIFSSFSSSHPKYIICKIRRIYMAT